MRWHVTSTRFTSWGRHQESLSKMFVIRQRMCYHRGREEERWSGVFRHSPDPPQPTWTRLERIQQLSVYWENLGKSASSRWHVTSHYFALLAWHRWVARQERSTPMKRFSYRERDYSFGQAMLTLRTTIGLTQAGLADLLGVSRRAVGEWEAGSSYPKAHHLQHVIRLAMQQQAFAAGREEEEIRAFWKAAHQKVLLDEVWLSALLTQPPAPPAPLPVEAAGGAVVGSAAPAAPSSLAQASQPGQSPLSGGPAASRASAARS